MKKNYNCFLIRIQNFYRNKEELRLSFQWVATLLEKRNGAFYEPTILDNVTKDMDVAKDMEIFGPVISVIGFDTIEEYQQAVFNKIESLLKGILIYIDAILLLGEVDA